MNIQGGCQNTPPYKEWLCTYHCIGRGDSICSDKPISECMPRNKKENQFNRVGIYLYFLNCLRSAFWLWINMILCLLCNYHCHCLFVFVGAVKIGSILSMVFCYLWLLCFSYSSTSTSVVIYQGAGESGSFLSFCFFLFILLIVVLFNCVQHEHECGYLSGSWRKWFLPKSILVTRLTLKSRTSRQDILTSGHNRRIWDTIFVHFVFFVKTWQDMGTQHFHFLTRYFEIFFMTSRDNATRYFDIGTQSSQRSQSSSLWTSSLTYLTC